MSNRVYSLSALLAFVLVALIGWFAVVSPQRQNVTTANAQIQTAQHELAALEADTAAGTATRKTVRIAHTDLHRLRTALPGSYAEPTLIDTLQQAARHTGVDFQTISFTAPTSASAATTSSSTTAPATSTATPLGFTLTVAGGYFKVSRFVARLQNMAGANAKKIWASGRLIAFTSLALSASKTAAGTVSATLSGSAYLLPKNPSAAAATTTTPATATTSPPASS